jgi:hypothetical protein
MLSCPEAFLDWTPPRELTGALPRKTLAKGGVPLGVFAALSIFGSSVLLFSEFREESQELARTAALSRGSSRETVGEVTRFWYKRRGSPAVVSYVFPANGVAHTGECSLPQQLHFRRGDNLIIRFLTSNPAINHPAAWEVPKRNWWVECASWMLLPVGAIWLFGFLRRDRQLLAEGVPTAGVVLSCSRWGSRGVWRVKYQFRMPDGRVAEGSSYSDRSEIGSTICVLYLPQNPRRNKVYSGLSYRVAQ